MAVEITKGSKDQSFINPALVEKMSVQSMGAGQWRLYLRFMTGREEVTVGEQEVIFALRTEIAGGMR